jgi:hypothetical protein
MCVCVHRVVTPVCTERARAREWRARARERERPAHCATTVATATAMIMLGKKQTKPRAPTKLITKLISTVFKGVIASFSPKHSACQKNKKFSKMSDIVNQYVDLPIGKFQEDADPSTQQFKKKKSTCATIVKIAAGVPRARIFANSFAPTSTSPAPAPVKEVRKAGARKKIANERIVPQITASAS